MELFAGAAFTWCAVYAVLATYFAVLATRPTRYAAEYALFASSCVAMAGYAFCRGAHYHASDSRVSAAWSRGGLYFALLAAALVLAVVRSYVRSRVRAPRWMTWAAAALAIALIIANALGALHHVGRLHERRVGYGGLVFLDAVWEPTPYLPLAHVFLTGSVAFVLTLLSLAYLRGKREALLVCIGGGVLATAIVSDVLVANDLFHGAALTEHAFSLFAFCLSYTLLARHLRRAEELTARASDLRRRGREIRRAFEELRAAQRQLVQREQLALIGEIAAVVSHEIRNPIAVIVNAVAGLRRPEMAEGDHAALLSIMEEELERMNHLVRDLLRYAKPFTVERKPVDLLAVVDRACESVSTQPDITIERHVEAGMQGEVSGDPILLRQVFENLVQNACQAMPRGGTLTVRFRDAKEPGGGVVTELADTGEGMNAQVRSRVRTPFFTTRAGGTGLGLAISDRIVVAHGGKLFITSRAGEGTLVSVYLPAAGAEELILPGTPNVGSPPSLTPFVDTPSNPEDSRHRS